ncbi:hypothetical protein Tco_1338520 [Tanacetum coccineum]
MPCSGTTARGGKLVVVDVSLKIRIPMFAGIFIRVISQLPYWTIKAIVLSDNEVEYLQIKTENQAKITKRAWVKGKDCAKSRPKSKNAKVRVNTEESAVKPEPELKNTIGCNLNPSDGPGKPNSIIMKTVKTLNAQS